jgi:UDP-glucuronate decarboxylase
MKPQDTVLITGGAGFVGSHIVDRLLESGAEVIVVDNFHTGSKTNFAQHLTNPRFELIRHNVWEPLYIEVDRIFNMACAASPVHYQAVPVGTVKTSVLGAMNMLGLARRCKARIFQASTSEVYGDPREHPQREEYWGHVNPIGTRACYDEGKRCAETLFFDYHRQYGVDIRVGRIFNTYGPRMRPDDGRVVSNFIWQALRGEPLTVYGDGSQTRSFCYVDDLVEAILCFMERDDVTGPLNLGNPGEFTMLELAQSVLRLTDSKSKIEFRPLPADDPVRRKPDISRARAALGWSPRVQLEDGLKETIGYFRQLLNGTTRHDNAPLPRLSRDRVDALSR